MKKILYFIFYMALTSTCYADDTKSAIPFNLSEAQFYFLLLGIFWGYYIIVKILFCKTPKPERTNTLAKVPEDLTACEVSVLIKKGFSASHKLLLIHLASMLNSKAISIEEIVPAKKGRGYKYSITALNQSPEDNEEKNWVETFPQASISRGFDEKLMLYEKHLKEDLCEQIENKYINKNKPFLWGGSVPFIGLLAWAFYCEAMAFLLLIPTGLFTFFFAPYFLRTFNQTGINKFAQIKALKAMLSNKKGCSALTPDQINVLYAYAIALNIEKKYEKNFEYLLNNDLKLFTKYRGNLYFTYQSAITVPRYNRHYRHSLITINLGDD